MKYLGALLAVVATAVVAQQPNPDQSFYNQAAEAGIAEVEVGTLAQSKGASAAVKDFGSKMVTDHGKANAKLKAIAAGKQIALPTKPDAEHQALKRKLEGLTGAAFDTAYIDSQVTGHKKVAALLEQEIATGKDAEAKAFAAENLPVVKGHLDMAEKLKSGHSTMKH